MSILDDESTNNGLSTARIEAFSDGVFAIVITLLILEIKVPEISSGSIATELPHKLLELWPKLFSYVTSFLIVGIYWVAHHNAFSYVKKADRLLLWINILFLMCLSFIPFPTALFGEYIQQPIASAFYGFTLFVTAGVFTFMWWYITDRRRLLRPDADQRIIRLTTRGGFVGLPFYLLAIIFSFISIPASIVLYIVIPLFYIFATTYRSSPSSRIEPKWSDSR